MHHVAMIVCLLGAFLASCTGEQDHEPWKNFNNNNQAPTAAPWANSFPYNQQPYGHPYYRGHQNAAGNPYYRHPYQNFFPYNYKYPAAPAAPAHAPYTQAPAPAAPPAHHQAPAPVYQAPAPVYQAPVPVYQAPAPVYQAPAPVYQAPVAGQVYHGGLVFIGQFEGTCEDKADGLYYIDDRSFAYCTGGRKTIQACAGGSANPDYDHFKAGERYQHYEFCSINLAALLNH